MADIEEFAVFDNQNFFDNNELLDENGDPLVRWAPLGANDTTELSPSATFSDEMSDIKLQNIMEEHEVLNTSLLSLTSHFAQVQFRLEQVLHAEPDQKEPLLRELEQFAWKGFPDLKLLRSNSSKSKVEEDAQDEPKTESQKKYVKLVIDQLKTQLDDLETFAYKNGEIQHPPTQSVLEKQRIMLSELGVRLGFNVEHLHAYSDSEIKEQIESAIMQLTNPIKTHEALVAQLKTQIGDLERFIDFLHDEETPDSNIVKALQAFKKQQEEQLNGVEQSNSDSIPSGYHFGNSRRRLSPKDTEKDADANQKTVGLITRALGMLHLFTSSQLAGRQAETQLQQMERTTKVENAMTNSSAGLKSTAEAKMHHWGDVRAHLEMAIETVVEKSALLSSARLQHQRNKQQGNPPGAPPIAPLPPTPNHSTNSSCTASTKDMIASKMEDTLVKVQDTSSCCRSDKPDVTCVNAERELNWAVRKQLCPALALLIEHGLRIQSNTSFAGNSDLHPKESEGILATWGFGCFSRRGFLTPRKQQTHDGSGSESDDDEEERKENKRRERPEGSAWNVFQKFYVMKNGRAFNDTPARKLSESFALDIIGGKVVTAKQQLLSSMGTILQLFNKYKRSEESQFRALVCIALNNHKLVPWLRLVLRNPLIIQYLYHPWSYVSSTGFDDALQSLNKLSSLDFNLPFDANVRHLQAIQDVF